MRSSRASHHSAYLALPRETFEPFSAIQIRMFCAISETTKPPESWSDQPPRTKSAGCSLVARVKLSRSFPATGTSRPPRLRVAATSRKALRSLASSKAAEGGRRYTRRTKLLRLLERPWLQAPSQPTHSTVLTPPQGRDALCRFPRSGSADGLQRQFGRRLRSLAARCHQARTRRYGSRGSSGIRRQTSLSRPFDLSPDGTTNRLSGRRRAGPL